MAESPLVAGRSPSLRTPSGMTRYEELGRRIDGAWGRAHRDERRFPDVAFEALTVFEPGGFDLDDVGRFLLATTIRQQPETDFSNLPVTVYQGDGFHLELLVWTRASTCVHQHAFSGAFRVVAGSSLHSEYRFTERQRINSHLLLGDIEMAGMRLLRIGDVLPIVSGREGLVHSLFHLEEPSVTLVARTSSDPESGPQYDLLKPRFAFDSSWANADTRVSIIHRWLAVAHDTGIPNIPESVLNRLVELDSARLFAIVSNNAGRFSDDVFRDGFLEKLRVLHPHLADDLADLARIARHQSSLSATRGLIKDPDVRFLVALLLNARSRRNVLDMIRAREPDADAETRCVDLLLQLGDPVRLAVALRERSPLLLRLSMALDAASDLARPLVEAIVRGESLEQAIPELPSDPAQRQFLMQADKTLRMTQELSALFQP